MIPTIRFPPRRAVSTATSYSSTSNSASSSAAPSPVLKASNHPPERHAQGLEYEEYEDPEDLVETTFPDDKGRRVIAGSKRVLNSMLRQQGIVYTMPSTEPFAQQAPANGFMAMNPPVQNQNFAVNQYTQPTAAVPTFNYNSNIQNTTGMGTGTDVDMDVDMEDVSRS
ncbi:hypothetical protein CVT24_008987 [Panaeolus cyanescens]|uniref:Uncharacterized protein n=1 Tax=Panaeolus cyanescens TaxID=181874 RepID=A0A409YAP7_9AGAR|nr:hypothetical protein CVT24_008987 [Panaeolus cyanescens]